MMEDSPIMGVLTPKSEASTQRSPVSEGRIQKAIWKRADHFLANSESMTLVGVRRLLEEDLGLEKNALDPFKKYISQQIDQVFNPPKGVKSAKDVEKNLDSKELDKNSGEEGPESSGGGSDDDEDKVKSRKETAPSKKKMEDQKKRKRSKESDDASSKKSKLAKRQKDENEESNDDGNVSEDGQSQSSAEKPAVKREKSVSGYGKKVEHLKAIIKACGMSVAPSIYKKAKQLHDDKREAFIVKELEGFLSREGLSKNPSEKEIKDCRKRKETAKELEGIDMSNIISSARRRSTFSFVAPSLARGDKISAKNNKNKDKIDKVHNKDNDEEEVEEKTKEEGEEEEEKTKEEEDEKKTEEEEEEGEEEVEEEGEDDDDEEDEGDESEDFNEGDNEESD